MIRNITTRTTMITDEEINIMELIDYIEDILIEEEENNKDKNIIKKYYKIHTVISLVYQLIDKKIYLQAHYELEKLCVWIVENIEFSEKFQEVVKKIIDLKTMVYNEYPKNHSIDINF